METVRKLRFHCHKSFFNKADPQINNQDQPVTSFKFVRMQPYYSRRDNQVEVQDTT